MITKQNYLKPEVEIIEFASESLMLIASGETDGAGTGEGSADDGEPELSNGRRGVWGNRWENLY